MIHAQFYSDFIAYFSLLCIFVYFMFACLCVFLLYMTCCLATVINDDDDDDPIRLQANEKHAT